MGKSWLANHWAYFLVHSFAILLYFWRSFLNSLAMSGTNGSSGFGSHKSEQIDKRTEKKNQIFIILAYYVEAHNKRLGPSKRLSAWTTELRRNVAAVKGVGGTFSDLTRPVIETRPPALIAMSVTTTLTGRAKKLLAWLLLLFFHCI